MKKLRGFTLIELITVIAIIGILSAIVVPSYKGYIDKAKRAKAVSIGEEIFCAAVWSYRRNNCIYNQQKLQQDVNDITSIGLQYVEISGDKSVIKLFYGSEGRNYIVEAYVNSNTYIIKEKENGIIVFQ